MTTALTGPVFDISSYLATAIFGHTTLTCKSNHNLHDTQNLTPTLVADSMFPLSTSINGGYDQ